MSLKLNAHHLTAKQEHFAQLVAAGSNHSVAYRLCYNVAESTPYMTTNQHAYALTIHADVALRVAELQALQRDAAEAALAWDAERLAKEAGINLELARAHGQIGPANGALAYIGKATGLVTDSGAKITINTGDTYNNNQWLTIQAGLADVLAPFPEARAAIVAWLDKMDAPGGDDGQDTSSTRGSTRVEEDGQLVEGRVIEGGADDP